MADTEKLIKIIFEGVDNLSGVADTVAGSIGSLNSGIESVAAPFASLGDSILTVDKYLLALAVGGMAYATLKAIDLESAVVGLDKVLSDQEQKSLPGIVDQMSVFADAYGFTAAEAVTAAGEFRKASFVLEDAAHLAELSAKLVIGAGEANFQMGQSTATLTALLKGFRVAQEDVVETSTHMADVLNKLADEYAVSVSSLSEGLVILAPLADGLGFSFDEMAGLLVPAIEIFGSGAQAANGMKTALSALSKPTKEVTKILDKFGISLTDVNGNQKQVKQILDELVPSFVKLSKAEQTTVAATIAGVDQSSKFTAVLKGMNTALEATATASTNAGGSLDKELARGLATAEVQMKRFVASFNNLAAGLGIKFLESTKDVTKGATDIQIALRKIVEGDGFKAVFDFINESGKELATLFQNIAKNLPDAFKGLDFSGLINSFVEIKENILSTFDLDLSTTEGLTAAIQTVINVLELLIETSSGIYNAFKPYITGVLEAANNTGSLEESSRKAVGELLGIAKVITELGGILGVFMTTMIKSGHDMEAIFNIIVGSIKVVVNGIQASLDVTIGGVIKFIQVFAEAVSFAAKLTPFDGLKEGADDFKKSMDELVAANLYSFKENVLDAAAGATQAFDAFGSKIDETKKKLEGKPTAVLKFDKKAAEAEAEAANQYWLKKIGDFKKQIDEENEIPIKIGVTLSDDAIPKLDEFKLQVRSLEKYKDIQIKAQADISLSEETEGLLDELENIDNTIEALTSRKRDIEIGATARLASGNKPIEELTKEFGSIQEKITDLTERKKEINLELKDDKAYQEVVKLEDSISELEQEQRIIQLQSEVNKGEGFGKIVNELEVLEDGSYKITINPELEGKGTETVEKKIDKLSKDRKFVLEIETKRMEEETKRIVAQVESSSKIIEKSMDFKFQLDIKKAELDLLKVTKAFDSTKEVLIAVTKASADMFGAFSTDFDTRTLWLFQEQLRQNLDIQKQQADQQKKLNAEILKELELKNRLREKFINGDEALLKIDIDDGVEPTIEAFIRYLIPRLQLWGTQNDVGVVIDASG